MHASGAGFLFINLLVFGTQRVPRACGRAAPGQRTSDGIEYVVITTNSPDCRLTEAFQGPRLQYRSNATSDWTNLPQDDLVHVGDYTSIQNTRVNVTRFVVDFRNETEPLLREGSELRFVQWEHRGGFCDCWAVANLTINRTHLQSNDSTQCGGRDNKAFFTSVAQNLSFDQGDIVAIFCHDNALAPREFLISLNNPNSPNINCTVIDDSALKVPPTECSDGSELRVEVNFDLKLRLKSSGCDEIDDFNEGVELSFRKLMNGGPGEWIPFMFFANLSTNTQPLIELPSIESIDPDHGTFTLRGYNLTYVIENENHHYNISVCGESVLQYPLQFRWLYSSYQVDATKKDIVMLDSVTVSVRNSTHAAYLLQDCFDCPNFNDHALWDSELSYNVYLLNSTSDEECRPLYGGALFFYLQPPINFFLHLRSDGTEYTISSRELVTKPLDPRNVQFSPINSESLFTCENVSCELTTETEQPTTATVPPTDKESTSEPSTLAASTPSHTAATTLIDGTTTIMTEVSSDSLELGVFNMISGSLSRLLTQVQSGQPFTSLSDLNQLLVSGEAVNLTEVMYVFSFILTRFDSETASPLVSELILQIASRILDIAVNSFVKTNSSEDVAGSTLLQIMDRFALNNHNKSQMVTSENIVFHVDVVSLNETTVEMISPIEGESAEISIPIREVLKGVEREEQVRMAAFLFRNTSGLLPNRLEGDDNDKMKNSTNERVLRLASPVISASFQCENCTTSNLSTPVQVTFKHLLYDEALLTNDISAEVTCVYWKFNKDDVLRPGAVLFRGQWSQEGCETNFTSTMTVCKCNHLTHFAILLSARPLELSPAKTLALQTIGYIGISISLVAMAATIFVFLFLKPLRTMRNYIHIQLCITLGIAQIIFVAGIQPRLGDGHLVGGVPVGCRLVAVLLHYWFLVSFMWMLMEGVVLYVALVRVFVKYHARYIVAFTIASYGLPLLYVGGLTIPLGFARSEDIRKNQTYDYGYEQACYLNPATAFIWSIIAPVIVIFLANIGFFIMAVVIMQRHQKRQHSDNTKHKVKHWLKAAVSLTVVMGLTWIIGILIIEVEELCALAFIFTIFVAFQGLFIFVIFILLSKQVRENYAKWWKAKVAESDFLSKHFEKKSFTLGTGTMAQRSGPSTSLAKTNGHTSTASKSTDQQSQVVENSTSDFKSPDLKMDLTNGKVDGDSIEMKRASPNLYVLN